MPKRVLFFMMVLITSAGLVFPTMANEKDLNLEERGESLSRTEAPVSYQGKNAPIFILQTGFPSSTSSNGIGSQNQMNPSLNSTSDGINPDFQWKLTASLGTLGVGRGNSEQFELQLFPTRTSRPSVFRIQRIQSTRTPINANR